MKLGILLCDDVRSELQIRHNNYPEMFSDILLGADPTLELVFYRVMDNQLPASFNECDAYIGSGSKYSVYDDIPWIHHLAQFVRDLYQHNIPFVGVCFGHQMIAHALGGTVVKSENGWGVGLKTWSLVANKQWMQSDQTVEEKNTFSLAVSHQDQVTDLPDDAEILASSNFCPHAMIQVGQHFLGIQGHPEFTSNYSRDLMIARRGDIPAYVIEAAKASLDQYIDQAEVTQWMLEFIKVSISRVPN
ncbi:gamma-glutamyl-gamma-aminobutyrate hydrolase family protein [Photobacterium profundum]|uniref:glutamine amidotransferase-related protein n=1 Tax=Photobacterium profundum TaxID=74109 RepID=UPI003D1037B0